MRICGTAWNYREIPERSFRALCSKTYKKVPSWGKASRQNDCWYRLRKFAWLQLACSRASPNPVILKKKVLKCYLKCEWNVQILVEDLEIWISRSALSLLTFVFPVVNVNVNKKLLLKASILNLKLIFWTCNFFIFSDSPTLTLKIYLGKFSYS